MAESGICYALTSLVLLGRLVLVLEFDSLSLAPVPDTERKLMADAQMVILGSVGISVANNTVANLMRSNDRVPPLRPLVGGFFLASGLLVLSEFKPEPAKAIAILVLVASLIGPNGTALISLAEKLAKNEPVIPSQNGTVIFPDGKMGTVHDIPKNFA